MRWLKRYLDESSLRLTLRRASGVVTAHERGPRGVQAATPHLLEIDEEHAARTIRSGETGDGPRDPLERPRRR
jgi:hypothetical protein